MANKPELDTIDTPKAKQLSRSWLTTTGAAPAAVAAVAAVAEAVVGAGVVAASLDHNKMCLVQTQWPKMSQTTACPSESWWECTREEWIQVQRVSGAAWGGGDNCLHKLKINVNRMHGTINRHPCAFP